MQTVASHSGRVDILVNTTTMHIGGGIQVATGFVEHAARESHPRARFNFALSSAVRDTMAPEFRKDPRMHVFRGHPAHPIRGRSTRRALRELEARVRPTLVYSVGFPSYVEFRSPEIGQYTNGWEICWFPEAWRQLRLVEKARRTLRSKYRLTWARHAKYFETQTETAKAGIVRRLQVDPSRVLVVPNSINPRFVEAGRMRAPASVISDRPRVFCVAAAFPHKNLGIIPRVAAGLAQARRQVATFVLTLPDDAPAWLQIREEARRLGVSSWIENVGPLTLDQCVAQYTRATCVFLPTLAEIFSATYVEAMAMRVPIVTTDLDFAHSICGDAAVYYSPLSFEKAAAALTDVLRDDALRWRLVSRGIERMRQFPDAETNYTKVIDWLLELADASPTMTR